MTVIEPSECSCKKCPHCDKRFSSVLYKKHEEKCKDNHKELQIYFDDFLGMVISNVPPQDED